MKFWPLDEASYILAIDWRIQSVYFHNFFAKSCRFFGEKSLVFFFFFFTKKMILTLRPQFYHFNRYFINFSMISNDFSWNLHRSRFSPIMSCHQPPKRYFSSIFRWYFPIFLSMVILIKHFALVWLDFYNILCLN